jgi:hypothetical protein
VELWLFLNETKGGLKDGAIRMVLSFAGYAPAANAARLKVFLVD